jgi:peptidoglycan/xylan/chitin deacetylase (PgdA/CDA1 family)
MRLDMDAIEESLAHRRDSSPHQAGIIFMLHRVISGDSTSRVPINADLEVSTTFLGRALKATIDAGFEVLTLDEAFANRSRRHKPFAIFTFDDGYRDNVELALPIFEKHNAPLTIYLCTDFVDGTGTLWWYALEELLWGRESLCIRLPHKELQYSFDGDASRVAAFYELRTILYDCDHTQRDSVLTELFKVNDFQPSISEKRLVMSWDEVRAYSHHPLVTFGSHTIGHHALSRLPLRLLQSELVESKHRIERCVGSPVHHFCYPFGSPTDSAAREFTAAADAGYLTATTTVMGGISRGDYALHSLPRVPIRGGVFQSDALFSLLLRGVSISQLFFLYEHLALCESRASDSEAAFRANTVMIQDRDRYISDLECRLNASTDGGTPTAAGAQVQDRRPIGAGRPKVVFLIGSADISGGTYVIFEHASYCLERGCDVVMVPLHAVEPAHLEWHPKAKSFRWTSYDEIAKSGDYADLVVATWWATVFHMHKVRAHRHLYFVQSIESRFFSDDQLPLRKLVDATYTLPMPIITEAQWIKEYLVAHYGREVFIVRNGARKDIYTRDGEAIAKRETGKLRVLVEGPVDVAFKNVPRTIDLCRRSKADEVWLLTSSQLASFPGCDRVFSRIPIQDVPSIYRSCDVIVKLSYVEGMFGPPLEMFHCGGTAITYDVTGYDEYIVHGENALVAKTDDEDSVVGYLNMLKTDPALLGRLKSNAISTAAAWPSWAQASELFMEAIHTLLKREPDTTISEVYRMARFYDEFYVVGEKYRLELERLNRRIQPLRKVAAWPPVRVVRHACAKATSLIRCIVRGS